jgi:SAM-dependent methyltransferase
MPAWGYIQQSSKLKDLLARWLGYPHPLGRVAANIVCRYANFKSLRTLDIGCDAGVYSFEFLNRGVKEIISMDIESQALQAARENILRFDCDPLLLLQEISRVLEPGGRLILSVPNERYLTKSIISYDFSEILRIIGHEHAGFYLEDVQTVFEQTQLEIKEHRYYYKFFSRLLTEIIYIALGSKRRKAARTSMVNSGWSAMIAFLVIYPLLKLDYFDPDPRGGCLVVHAINRKAERKNKF